MNYQRILALTIFLFYGYSVLSQGVKGSIHAVEGTPISFASIYFPQLGKGTTANLEGDFQLPLPPGKFEMIVQYLGYQSVKDTVSISSDWVVLNITLEVQHYQLSEIIVTASGEDPAYFVMRKAIGMSQYYRNQIGEYNARVYLKGTGVPIKIPRLLRKQLKEEGIEEGKYYVTETISDIFYQIDQPLQTRVIASRSAGFGDDATPMQFATISLYDDINGIISPLSRDAFAVYNFKLEGTFVEDGHTINKIRVLPKRKGQDLYQGIIHVREGSWSLYMVELAIEQKLFNATLKQVYHQVAPYVWLPVSHDFHVNLDFMGGQARFTYLVTVNDYKVVLNPKVNHQFYFNLFDKDSFETLVEENRVTNQTTASIAAVQQSEKIAALVEKDELSDKEMRKLNRLVGETNSLKRKDVPLEIKSRETQIADSAKLMDRTYWDAQRPVPLTEEERISFNEVIATNDSNAIKVERKKTFNAVLWGVNRMKIHDSVSISYPGLLGLQSFNFNTVDGFTYAQSFQLYKMSANSGFWKADLDLGYAFSRKRFFGEAGFSWLHNPIKRSSLKVLIGSESKDYNPDRGILPVLNAITSLFFRQNFLKLQEKTFAQIGYQTDITNGLVFDFKVGYNRFSMLNNNSSFSFFNPFKKEYTENIPKAFMDQPELFEDHQSFEYVLQLNWTPRYYYRIINGRKQMAYSNFPTFSVLWKQALKGVFHTDADFSQLEFSMKQHFSTRLYGNISYEFSAGGFPKVQKIYFQDYQHLQTQPLLIAESPAYNSFLGINYYERSLAGNYFTAFMQVEHSRILLKRIPFLAGSLLRESISFKMHAGDGFYPYYELNYGVHQIFLLMNVNVFAGFEKGMLKTGGIRIGIPIRGGTVAL